MTLESRGPRKICGGGSTLPTLVSGRRVAEEYQYSGMLPACPPRRELTGWLCTLHQSHACWGKLWPAGQLETKVAAWITLKASPRIWSRISTWLVPVELANDTSAHFSRQGEWASIDSSPARCISGGSRSSKSKAARPHQLNSRLRNCAREVMRQALRASVGGCTGSMRIRR